MIRKPEYYDETWEYLRSIGIEMLDSGAQSIRQITFDYNFEKQ